MTDQTPLAMPQISVTVMAHPKRAAQAEALASEVADLPTRIIFDPDPSGPPSTVRVAKLAWRPWDDCATHHLVLQDDVLLHPHFTEQVGDAVQAQPDAALSFFTEWGSFTSHALRIAAFAGASWVRQPDTYLATVAMVLPTVHAHGFANLLERSASDLPDDHAAFQYVRDSGLPHYVSNPNLVDHDHLPSLVGNTGQGLRRAAAFVPDEVATPSWWRTEPYDDLTVVPSIHWTSGTPSSYEAPDDRTSRWTISRRREHWGEARAVISAMVREEIAVLLEATDDVRLHAALLEAGSILADQIVLASHSTLSISEFASACAVEAARTLAPGSLRAVARELNASVDSELTREVFARLASRLRTVVGLVDE